MAEYYHQIDNSTFGGVADFTATTSVLGVLPTKVWYEHSTPTGTHTAGTKCTFVQLAARENGAGNISLDGATSGIVLAADTGTYEVTVFADTEAPASGDTTTLKALVGGVEFSFFNVSETGNQVGSWSDLIDTTGAAQTVEVDRHSVTGTGRLDVKVIVERVG